MIDMDMDHLAKIAVFGLSALVGMGYAYVVRWAAITDREVSVTTYLFGDKRAVVKAVSTLIVMCTAAGGLDYLYHLGGFDIFVAGAGIGYLVPKQADEKNG